MQVSLLDTMGTDNSVCDAARVSFNKKASEYSEEQNIKLIKYLAKHNHWSPFAHCFLQFRIKAPIFVSRQMVKHQVGLAWNEVSRRYVDEEPEFWFPTEWRGKPVNAKQGSSDIIVDSKKVEEALEVYSYSGSFLSVIEACLNSYKNLIKLGVAPEQARMVLPQNMMTEWIWSGSLMAFARVCKLRLDPHAQAETREVAAYIAGHCEVHFPVSFKALMEN